MKTNQMLRGGVAVFALFFLGGCGAHWDPVAYHPNPMAKEKASEEIERLMMVGRDWRPLRIEMKSTYITMFYDAGPQVGIASASLSFEDIESMQLLFAPKWNQYDVDVKNAKGETIMRYTAPDKAKAMAFMDALSVVVHPERPLAPNPNVKTL